MLETDEDVYLAEGEVRVTGLYVVSSGRTFLIRRMVAPPQMQAEDLPRWRRFVAFVLCGAMAGATVAALSVMLHYELPLVALVLIAAAWASVGVVLDRKVFAPRYTIRIYHDDRWFPLLETRDAPYAYRVYEALMVARRRVIPMV